MATRKKRTAKKAPAKRANSQIAVAQRETAARRQARAAAMQAKAEKGGATPAKGSLPPDKNNSTISAGSPPLTDPKLQAAQQAIDPHRKRQPVLQQNTRPTADTFKGGPQAASKIAGLASGIMDARQQEIKNAPPNPLADASNYGSANNKARAARVSALMNAQQQAQRTKLTSSGKAVWMGATRNRAKIRNSGPERMDPEGLPGKDYTTESVGDDVRSTDELMSWLADEKTFNQIRTAAQKAGISVQSYDDVAKVWQQVVQQAASTYSTTGKKVTPWSLLQLRGKTMVNGRPAAKTTTSSSIDEMDPDQAKVMLKNSLSQMLGRDPRQDEIDDFISKAQMIAKANPQITTTTTQYGFDGNPVSQASTSKGGGDAVTAKAQLEAEQIAQNAPDYAEYQASGVYMPWLNEALASPV